MIAGLEKWIIITQALWRMLIPVIFANVLVSKMDSLENLEEEFGVNVEKLDKDFLESLRNSGEKPREVLEKEYKTKLKQLLFDYEANFKTLLSLGKKSSEDFKDPKRIMAVEEEQDQEDRLDMSKPYESKHLDMKFSKEQLNEMHKSIEEFKRKIKYRKFFHETVPEGFVTLYFRTKIFWRNFKISFLNLIFRIESGTRSDFSELLDFIKDSINKLVLGLTVVFSYIVKKVKSIFSKTKEKEGEESEDAKIAAKILQKKN